MSDAAICRQFAESIDSISMTSLPTEVIENTKDRILDSISTATAAVGLPVPTVASALVAENTGRTTVVGHPKRVPAVDAAFVNATLVNGRTQDDFLYKSHPGAISVPAALAAAEHVGRGGADVVEAVVVGYEITSRVYMGGPTMLPKFRATGVAGTIGAAATAAKLLGLSVDKIADALGCAAVFASGFGAGFLSGTMEVKLNVGMACRNGVSAALLAQHGATASDLAFEGEAGFYRAMAGTVRDVSEATRDLGKKYLLNETIYKEFPVCIFVQTPMAVARELADAYSLDPRKITSVSVTVDEPTYTNPGFTNKSPYATSLRARVSARFCVSAALLGRPITDYALYDEFDDPEVLALAERVDLMKDPAVMGQVKVEVVHDGQLLSLTGNEGETLHPSRDKIIAKYRRLTSDILGSETESVLESVLQLENLRDLEPMMAKLRDFSHSDAGLRV